MLGPGLGKRASAVVDIWIQEVMNEKIFIVGFWNSGTSILAELLDKHRDLSCLKTPYNENHELYHGGFVGASIRKIYGHLFDVSYEEVIEHGVDCLEIRANDKLPQFVEKINREWGVGKNFVKYNRLVVCKDLLDAAFPDAKRIIMLRDGRSYAVSKLFGRDPVQKARVWVAFMKYVLRIWWGDRQTYFLRYENLCVDPVREVNGVLRFLGLEQKLPSKLPEVRNMNYKWDKFVKNHAEMVKEVPAIVADMNREIDAKIPTQE
jgi:hypothetical protein